MKSGNERHKISPALHRNDSLISLFVGNVVVLNIFFPIASLNMHADMFHKTLLPSTFQIYDSPNIGEVNDVKLVK